MRQIKFYCVTDKKINFINKENYNFGWVGNEDVPNHYIKCNNKDNIFYKEKNYSELTFHYWFWKNLMISEDDDQWIGFCQKRRYWIKENLSQDKNINKDNINDYLLTHIEKEPNYESIICRPINVNGVKKIKIFKSCLLYTSPSPRDGLLSRMPSSA